MAAFVFLYIKATTLTLILTLTFRPVYGVIVTTRYGDVVGNTLTLKDGTPVDYFYSIPYATAPIGNLRFKVKLFTFITNYEVIYLIIYFKLITLNYQSFSNSS